MIGTGEDPVKPKGNISVNEHGIPVLKTQQPTDDTIELNEDGVPVKKKDSTTPSGFSAGTYPSQNTVSYKNQKTKFDVLYDPANVLSIEQRTEPSDMYISQAKKFNSKVVKYNNKEIFPEQDQNTKQWFYKDNGQIIPLPGNPITKGAIVRVPEDKEISYARMYGLKGRVKYLEYTGSGKYAPAEEPENMDPQVRDAAVVIAKKKDGPRFPQPNKAIDKSWNPVQKSENNFSGPSAGVLSLAERNGGNDAFRMFSQDNPGFSEKLNEVFKKYPKDYATISKVNPKLAKQMMDEALINMYGAGYEGMDRDLKLLNATDAYVKKYENKQKDLKAKLNMTAYGVMSKAGLSDSYKEFLSIGKELRSKSNDSLLRFISVSNKVNSGAQLTDSEQEFYQKMQDDGFDLNSPDNAPILKKIDKYNQLYSNLKPHLEQVDADTKKISEEFDFNNKNFDQLRADVLAAGARMKEHGAKNEKYTLAKGMLNKLFPQYEEKEYQKDLFNQRASRGELSMSDHFSSFIGSATKSIINVIETAGSIAKNSIIPVGGSAFNNVIPQDKIKEYTESARILVDDNFMHVTNEFRMQQMKVGKTIDGLNAQDIATTIGDMAPTMIASMLTGGGAAAQRAVTFAGTYASTLPRFYEEARNAKLTGAAYEIYAQVMAAIEGGTESILPVDKLIKPSLAINIAKDLKDGLIKKGNISEYMAEYGIKHVAAFMKNASTEEIENMASNVLSPLLAKVVNSMEGSKKVSEDFELTNLNELITTVGVTGIMGAPSTIAQTSLSVPAAILLADSNPALMNKALLAVSSVNPSLSKMYEDGIADFMSATQKMPTNLTSAQKLALYDLQNKIEQERSELQGLTPEIAKAKETVIKALQSKINDIVKDPSAAASVVESATTELSEIKEQLSEMAESKPAEVKHTSRKDNVSVNEVIGLPVTYKGKPAIVELDGKTVVVKMSNNNREYEIGNIDEIGSIPSMNAGIEYHQSVVGISDNNNITVRGVEYKNSYSNQEAAINYNSKGDVVSVNLETVNGQKRTFRGQVAEEIAYQIKLQKIYVNNESTAELEQLVDNEISKQESAAEAKQTTTEKENGVNTESVRTVATIKPAEPITGAIVIASVDGERITGVVSEDNGDVVKMTDENGEVHDVDQDSIDVIDQQDPPQEPEMTDLEKELFNAVNSDELGDAVDSIIKSLSSIGVSVEVIDDISEWIDIAKREGADSTTQGFFVSDGVVYLNKTILEDAFDANIVVWHEATHPIINIIRNTNPDLFNRMVSGLSTLAGVDPRFASVINWAVENYSGQSILDEAVVETIARIASGDIVIGDVPKKFNSTIIDFINKILELLGIDPISNSTDAEEFLMTASVIANTLKSGGDISEIVGFDNIGEYGIDGLQARSIGEMMANQVEKLVSPGRKVSTRTPSAVNSPTDVHTSDKYIIDLKSSRENPENYIKNAIDISGYNIITGIKKSDIATLERGLLPKSKGGNEAYLKKAMKLSDEIYNKFVRAVADNLLWLHDSFDENLRGISKRWYDGANVIAQGFAKKYNVTLEQAAGVVASLSPQMDWYKNVSLAERVLDIVYNKKDFIFDEKMADKYVELSAKVKRGKNDSDEYFQKRIQDSIAKAKEDVKSLIGKSIYSEREFFPRALRVYDEVYNSSAYDILSPNGDATGKATNADGALSSIGWPGDSTIAKAISIIEEGSVENISKQLGEKHKVRNFYNNISDPNSFSGDVTIDTHAVAAGLLKALAGGDKEVETNLSGKSSAFTGSTGTYAAFAEAYRLAAKERGILPRQMQSITWEAVRGLFTNTFKANNKNKKLINDIWDKYSSGKNNIDETRQLINDAAEGIENPSWARSYNQTFTTNGQANNSGELSGSSSMGSDGRAGRRTNSKREAKLVRPAANQSSVGNRGQLLAPNGKPSKLTPFQYHQVRTKEFKNWFGDWENDPENASKVVDENGEPLVVFHGSNKNFDEFKKVKSERGGALGARVVISDGFFFTRDKGYAVKAAGVRTENNGGRGNIFSAFLNAKNVLDLSKFDYDSETDFKKITGEYPHEYFGYHDSLDQWWRIIDDIDGIGFKIKKLGYDAVYLAETTSNNETADVSSIAVFNPNQIKSATSNSGAFNPNDNRIQFSKQRPENVTSASVFIAPMYSLKANNFNHAKVIHNTDYYKKYVDDIKEVASTLGVTISETIDTLGSFQSVSEASTVVSATGDFDNIVKFAAVMSALAPEVQEASIAATLVEDKSKDHNAEMHEYEIQDPNEAMELLNKAGIGKYGYTLYLNKVHIFELLNPDTPQEAKDLFYRAIYNFENEYNEKYGTKPKYDHFPVRSEYIGREDRLRIISEEIPEYAAKPREDRPVNNSVWARAYNRSEAFANWKNKVSRYDPVLDETVPSDIVLRSRELYAKQIELSANLKSLPVKEKAELAEIEKELASVIEPMFSEDKEVYLQAKSEIDAIAEDLSKIVADSYNADYPIKRPSRASVKTVRWYDSQPNELGDGSRTTIIVKAEQDADFVFDQMSIRFGDTKGRSERETTNLGYPKRLMEVRTSTGKISEIQVMVEEAYIAKDGVENFPENKRARAAKHLREIQNSVGYKLPDGVGHYFYELNRDPNVQPEIRTLAEEVSKKYYDVFLNPESKVTETELKDGLSNLYQMVEAADKSGWDKGNNPKLTASAKQFISEESGPQMSKGGRSKKSSPPPDKSKEFKIAAFVTRKKIEGASSQEISSGLMSVLSISQQEADRIVSNPSSWLLSHFPNLTDLGKQNLISILEHKNIYAKRSKSLGINPMFANASIPQNIIEDYRKKNKNDTKFLTRFFSGTKRKYFDPAHGLPDWALSVKELSAGAKNVEISRAKKTLELLAKEAKAIGFTDWEAFSKALASVPSPITPAMSSSTGMTPFNPTTASLGRNFTIPNSALPAVVPQAISALPTSIIPFVYKMRAQIDGLTSELIATGSVTPEQAVNLEKNIGAYMNRAYKMYNESGYKPSEKHYNEALKHFADIKYKELATDYTNSQGLPAIGGIIPQHVSEQLMNEALDYAKGEVEIILSKSKNPHFNQSSDSRDTGILKERKDIPEVVRNLMGEYTDPGVVFMMTVSKQSALLSTSTYLQKLREFGLGVLFFERDDPSRPSDYATEIAQLGSESKNPLGGLFTTKEVAEALESVNPTFNDLTNAWMKIVGAVRWTKTVGSVVTQFKNFESNLGFAVMNGLIFTGGNFGSFNGARKYFGGEFSSKEASELTTKVRSLNLVGQSVTGQILAEMLGSGNIHDIALELALDKPTRRISKVLKAPINAANKLYRLSDDFWKVYAYLNEREVLARAIYGTSYSDLQQEQIEGIDIKASERVKNTWPTYDRVWEAAKYVSKRAPIFGNFIAFQAESLRVLLNTVQMTIDDIRDPQMRGAGFRRLAGIMTYLSARAIMVNYFASAAGIAASGVIGAFGSSEEEKRRKRALKTALPAYARTADPIIVKGDEPHKFTVYNMSSLDPYGIVFNSMNAITEGSGETDAGAFAAVGEFFGSFLEPEMTFETLWSTMNNNNLKTGEDIYMNADSNEEKISKCIMYVWDRLEPSTIALIERGIKRGWGPEGYSFFGARPIDVDLHKSFSIQLKRFQEDIDDITKEFNKVAYNKELPDEERLLAEKAAEAKKMFVINKMHEVYTDFISLGADPEVLDNIILSKKPIKITGFDKETKSMIITGQGNSDDLYQIKR